jgi:hypothetical protein
VNETGTGLGGALYINARESKLDLKIINCGFEESEARYRGGLLYLEAGSS